MKLSNEEKFAARKAFVKAAIGLLATGQKSWETLANLCKIGPGEKTVEGEKVSTTPAENAAYMYNAVVQKTEFLMGKVQKALKKNQAALANEENEAAKEKIAAKIAENEEEIENLQSIFDKLVETRKQVIGAKTGRKGSQVSAESLADSLGIELE